MNSSTEAVIIGGGVIGCSIAYHLAKVGVKVTLLERGRVGEQASSAASGVLSATSPDDDSPYGRLTRESLSMFHTLHEELRESCGVDTEFVQCGGLSVALSDREAGQYQVYARQQIEAGSAARWLDHQSVHDYEPELSPGVLGGLLSPETCRINNQRLTDAFARSAQWLGADIRQASEVVSLMRSGLRITGVRLHDEEIYADHIIIAAGPWSKVISEWVGSEVPVRPVRGQNINLTPARGSIRGVIHGSWGLLVPRNDGSIIAGATVEEVGFDCRVTAGGVRDVFNVATELVPSLADATLNWTIAGLRPGSPDDMPILGPIPRWDGLLIASGHYRNGILLSPITGKLIADHILGEDHELLEHFSIRRFREQPAGVEA